MKNLNLILFILVSTFCLGQKDTNWYAFYNQDSTKIGFKDVVGNIKIEPMYEQAMMSSDVFKNVIAVWDYAENYSGEQYYLNKNGRKFGKDSLYVFDFMFAEEYEGKIKFRDEKTDKVGFFDKNGKVVIPAVYNDAGDFHNGIAIVIKDAEKKCWKESNGKQRKYPDCEHWSWEGKTMVINTENKELFEIEEQDFIRNIDYNDIYKNFKLNKSVDPDYYISYKGNDGNTYSFYCPQKDFNKWFQTKFLPDYKIQGKISEKYYNKTILLQRKEKSEIINKAIFIDKYSGKVNSLFKKYLQNKNDIDFFDENMFQEENRSLAIDLRLSPKSERGSSKSTMSFHQESIVFTKTGDSFYITSAP